MDKETHSGAAAANAFFEHPILNSPYAQPERHWELDESGQPTQQIIEQRRSAKFITPIPKPKKRKASAQQGFVFDEGLGLSTTAQTYDPTGIINEVRSTVESWRRLPNPNQWQVTPETARLLQHWRHHDFGDVRPFFCQVEAAETAKALGGKGHQGSALLHRRLPEHRDLEARLRLHFRLPAQERRWHDDAGERPPRIVPELRRDDGQRVAAAKHTPDR